MAYEALQDSPLIRTLKDLFADLSDLVRKEVRLAKAEVAETVAGGVQAGIWMAVAGFLALIAVLLLVQAIVFGIASFGIGLHWASLIVAVVLAAIAAGAFFYGRSLAKGSLTPKRTLKQINEDIGAVREQLT
jgi:uncharacterized membrane protein YqjE